MQNQICSYNLDSSSPIITSPLPHLSGEGKITLLQEVTKIEVYKALMSMKSYKALGPDGFQPFFFKNYWDKIGDDIWHMVKDAFATGSLPSRITETLVVPIAKVDFPCTLGNFRPISFCNVVYEIIARALANRLKPHLTDSDDRAHKTFTKGRRTSN